VISYVPARTAMIRPQRLEPHLPLKETLPGVSGAQLGGFFLLVSQHAR